MEDNVFDKVHVHERVPVQLRILHDIQDVPSVPGEKRG